MHLTLIHEGDAGDEPAPSVADAAGPASVDRWLEDVDPALRVRVIVWVAGLTTGVRDRELAALEPIAVAGLRSEADVLAALSPATPAGLAVAACRLVANVGDAAAAAPGLRRLLRDASCARVRLHAAGALARLGGPDARAALTEALLRDDDEEVRARAARGLGALCDHRSVSTLCAALANAAEVPAVRSEAAEALGVIGRRSATPMLVRALRDPEPDVRAGAAYALGMTGGLDVVPALRSLERDPDVAAGLGPVADCAEAAIADIRRRALATG
jgi:HEAT repeat protein